MEPNFQNLCKLSYCILFWCFDYITFSLECTCTDIKTSRKTFLLDLLKLDYRICFLS